MRTVHVSTGAPYDVHVGSGVLARAAALAPAERGVAVVSDENVARLHGERLGPLARAPRLVLEPGEGTKSFAVLERTLDFLVEHDLDRRSTIVALGGGVVGDLAGLAASLYMRGVAVLQCPTSLLAMVDSSVGGKTAVNLAGGKNLAGTFHQPAAVLADVDTLVTLPREELQAGLGEVVKSALVGDGELLGILEERSEEIALGEPERLAEVVERCVRVKAAIVARDEREGGERKKLNLGHTFAHSIERTAGFGRIPHGVAVGTGLALALRASAELGLLREPGLVERVTGLLERLGLPADLGGLRSRYGHSLAADELEDGLRHDKKGRAGRPALVLVRDVADIALDQTPEPGLFARLFA